MEGTAATGARIATIEAHLASLARRRPVTAQTSAPTTQRPGLASAASTTSPRWAASTTSATSARALATATAPAAAFETMRDAVRARGVTLGVDDSYRSYDQQVDMAARKGLSSQGGLAAEPGTSDHGWGKAVDLQLDGRARAWVRANGPGSGFAEATPREPWHWVYQT